VDPLRHFREVWAVDFEFAAPPGHRPTPLCVVARELRSNRLVRQWLDGVPPGAPPYLAGPDSLLVAYYASAEWGCHLALGWPLPARVLDLFAEFACLTSGARPPHGRGLLGALAYFGLPALDAAEKAEMRDLAARGGAYFEAERAALLDYCQTDVDSLARLLPAMAPRIDVPRALLRGRYTIAAARMEWSGVPIDPDAMTRLRDSWVRIKARLVAAVDEGYGVFVPAGRELDPATRFGAAVLDAAREWGADPYALAEAAKMISESERHAGAARLEAVRAARSASGLSANRMERYLAAGKDADSVYGLDVTARELAGMYPDLGLGAGYDPEGPDPDYAGPLWGLLSAPDPVPRPKYDPSVIREAAELVGTATTQHLWPLQFSTSRWADYLRRVGIPWPRRQDGELALDDATFREMARLYPIEVGPIRELRHALGQLRLNELAVGPDGRNRVLLSMFGSKTGRNQPSNSKFIFGTSCWLRSLIRPGPGRAVAYVDWSAQELGIAAALSGDPRLKDAYGSGDPYLWFGKFAHLLPAEATKATHGPDRDRFKIVMLGVLYGLSEVGLARRLNISPAHGRQLLDLHRETFRRFWQWSDGIQDQAVLSGELRTVFGWRVRVGPETKATSLRNFPMQASAGEMLRLAACLATERGIGVCCPVHDAFLIEAADDRIEDTVRDMQEVMCVASEWVLPGFPLRTDAKVVRYPDRYGDARGRGMWETVAGILAEVAPDDMTPITGDRAPPSPVIPPPSLISSSSIPL
jgi:hypothetical protein